MLVPVALLGALVAADIAADHRAAPTAAPPGAAAPRAADGAAEPEPRTLQGRFDQALRLKQWDRVLALAATVPPGEYTPLVNHDVNRALFHTGRLPTEMFRYPQNHLGLLLGAYRDRYVGRDYSPRVFMRLADTAFELGLVNDAEHWAHERLQMEGDKPGILSLLVRVNLVKEQPTAARVFLNHMTRACGGTPAAAWARTVLADLGRDPALAAYGDIRHKRACRPTADRMTPERHPERDLLDLLDRNPHNRMALEYLMAHYLLTCNVTALCDNLHRLDAQPYDGIPLCWERAAAICLFLRRQLHPDGTVAAGALPGGRTLRASTVRETFDVHRRLAGYRPNAEGRARVSRALPPRYGPTYFTYSYTMLPAMLPPAAREPP
jgi:hypothetical protein